MSRAEVAGFVGRERLKQEQRQSLAGPFQLFSLRDALSLSLAYYNEIPNAVDFRVKVCLLCNFIFYSKVSWKKEGVASHKISLVCHFWVRTVIR